MMKILIFDWLLVLQYDDNSNLLFVSGAALNVLRVALNTRGKCFDSFVENQGNDVQSYTENHCDGKECFPRSNIDFGPTSRAENSRACRKAYRKGRSHTPGIFTVQCA